MLEGRQSRRPKKESSMIRNWRNIFVIILLAIAVAEGQKAGVGTPNATRRQESAAVSGRSNGFPTGVVVPTKSVGSKAQSEPRTAASVTLLGSVQTASA